jgi:CRISPR-associated protein Cmr3
MRERRPKPTRRLAPAGSVFFVQLPGTDRADDAAIEAWIDAIWMQNISDDHPGDPERDRRDGFGLAVLGAWDGELMTMEVQQ